MGVQVAHGAHGIVASGHALATDAALDVLKKGGNAVDAAICGALVLTVTCPYATSLAGDMYMLVFDPRGGVVSGLNATGCAPAAAALEQFPDGMPRSGIRAATVPGFLAGAADALDRFGTQTLSELIEPAIELAEKGFAVHPYFTKNINDRRDLLAKDAEASALFLPGGEPLKPGAHFVQADLVLTLRALLRDGVESFYRGALATRIVAASRKLGGLFTEADFAAHRSLWQEPVSGPFRGHTVWTMPPNSYGATLLLQLIELEANGIADCDPDGLDFITSGFAARRKSYAAAAKFIADPALGGGPVGKVLAAAIADGRIPSAGPGRPAEAKDRSTTNIVVIDKDGWAVSLIESISTPFGAGIVLDRRFQYGSGQPELRRAGQASRPYLGALRRDQRRGIDDDRRHARHRRANLHLGANSRPDPRLRPGAGTGDRGGALVCRFPGQAGRRGLDGGGASGGGRRAGRPADAGGMDQLRLDQAGDADG
jgi:gamma-glutamyltranspeptidase/glutathione hydrolase